MTSDEARRAAQVLSDALKGGDWHFYLHLAEAALEAAQQPSEPMKGDQKVFWPEFVWISGRHVGVPR